MILFLRNDDNRTIFEVDVYIKKEDDREFVEARGHVNVFHYSQFLLNHQEHQKDIIQDFYDLSEIRGWLWENYFIGRQNDPKEYDNVVKELRNIVQSISDKYGLYYVED